MSLFLNQWDDNFTLDDNFAEYSDLFDESFFQNKNKYNNTSKFNGRLYSQINSKENIDFNEIEKFKKLNIDNIEKKRKFSILSEKNIPFTPCKKKRLNSIAANAQAVSKKDTHSVITPNGIMSFKITQPVNAGNFKNISEIAPNQNELYPNYLNSEIYFCCFKPEVIDRDGSFIESYFNNILNQYQTLKDLEFPVAEILNAKTAKEDGFFLVEKIPGSIDIAFDSKTKLEELNMMERDYLAQIKAAFEYAYHKDIGLDFKKNNVGIRYKGDKHPFGEVVLFDMMEKQTKFKLFLNGGVKSFAKDDKKQINQDIFNYLMPECVS